MEKLKRQLADADAALEARKKPPEDAGPKIIGEGLVIDEWVSTLFTNHRRITCEMNTLSCTSSILFFSYSLEGAEGKISCSAAG